MAKNDSKSTALTTPNAPATLDQIGSNDVAAFIEVASTGEITELVTTGKLKAAAQLLTLETGQQICGIYHGPGKTMIDDPNTKQPKEVTTHSITIHRRSDWAPGPLVSILGAAQLDRQLASLADRNNGVLDFPVLIARGGTNQVKGKPSRQMTDYFCGVIEERR